MASSLERTFETLWAIYGRCRNDGWEGRWIPEREFVFHEVRKWRFDFAFPEQKVAVELDGLLPGKGGRHQRPKGFSDDCRKNNAAQRAGWAVFHFTREMLEAEPIACCEEVAAALASEGLAERGAG